MYNHAAHNYVWWLRFQHFSRCGEDFYFTLHGVGGWDGIHVQFFFMREEFCESKTGQELLAKGWYYDLIVLSLHCTKFLSEYAGWLCRRNLAGISVVVTNSDDFKS